jgi:hypothetical protein
MNHIKIRNPYRAMILVETGILRESTWAEKRRHKLVWRMRVTKAVINLLLFIPIWSATCLSVILALGQLSLVLESPPLERLLGIIMGFLIIAISFALNVCFPLNPRNVTVKHRGKWIC